MYLAQDSEEWRAVLKFRSPMETVKFLARWVSGSFSKMSQVRLWDVETLSILHHPQQLEIPYLLL
jgi:hypothetical protein